jgi:acetyl-CoA carboxylase biotin carboxyl carrier protein
MAKNEIDKELIRELAALMDETGLSEIEIENDDDRLRLVRATAAAAPAPALSAAVISVAAPTAPASEAIDGDLANHPGALLSPIVGTAFHAPSPDDAPFVKVGDQVDGGQTLLVIEAMKTFNEIPSARAGVVRQILFENASPVEYGDILMIIE